MPMLPVPKIIHFVWAGGGRVPQERRDYILSWKQRNPDWAVRFWYDASHLLSNIRNAYVRERWGQRVTERDKDRVAVASGVWKEVGRAVGSRGDSATIDWLVDQGYGTRELLQGIRMEELNYLLDFCRSNGLEFCEMSTLGHIPGKLKKLYDHEMSGNWVMGTNFGATSDLLRLMILLEEGGVYADSDVRCMAALGDLQAHPETPRYAITSEALPECYGAQAHGLQIHQWNDERFWRSRFAHLHPHFPALANSIIAAHPQSEGLKQYKRTIVSEYAMREQGDARRAPDRVVSLEDFRMRTIRATGPSAAEASVNYRDYTSGIMDKAVDEAGRGRLLDELLFCRDNLYFPMHCVVDTFAHSWLA